MKKSDIDSVRDLNQANKKIEDEISKIIVGQKRVIGEVLIALLSGGHCLIIGVPGLAKTLLVNTIAQVLDLTFNRIQFTPDLMPSDITGTQIIEEDLTTGKRSFRFIKGPIFSNVILADEINRTPPKTQSALLQAMQEYKVTVGGETCPVPRPFFVLATQNPIEQEGTYPLPEAQLDRFMFCITIEYPEFDEEKEIIKMTTSGYGAELKKVLTANEINDLQKLVRRIPVADDVLEYAVNMVRRSRPDNSQAPDFVKKWVAWGAGPRASQYLILASKTRAALDGRYTPTIEDVNYIAKVVLRHRIITNFNAEADGIKPDYIIDRLIELMARK